VLLRINTDDEVDRIHHNHIVIETLPAQWFLQGENKMTKNDPGRFDSARLECIRLKKNFV
jgi:hypothetical protein